MKQPDLFDTEPAAAEPRQDAPGEAGSAAPLDQTLNLRDWRQRLAKLCNAHVSVTFTENRRSMVSWRRLDHGKLALRAHSMFMAAPDDVVTALAGLLSRDDAARTRIGEYVQKNRHLIGPKMPRDPLQPAQRVVLRAVGARYDLRDLHRDVNDAYFQGRSQAHVTWGRPLRKKAPRHLNFGTYDSKINVITISRRLNDPDIPRYMVEFIMYHEILHELLGVQEKPSGRRDVHSKEFRRLERQFPHYGKAVAFERERWGVEHRGQAKKHKRQE